MAMIMFMIMMVVMFMALVQEERRKKELSGTAGPVCTAPPGQAIGLSKLYLKTRPMARMECSISLCTGLDDLIFSDSAKTQVKCVVERYCD
ncbi:hypothetical protein L3X38_044195 [Prunus dulcis]|uniref:Secreted protein n=1 Tax=Prunus dulcis TaxID=3755 RepID=A0AAD4UZI0_PRUDU|nr:hypothetical protein L3X38_044195 [Prunus dulcis]